MSFKDRVFEKVGQIPNGYMATYGQIAGLCGNSKATRAVGNILHKNFDSKLIPCHRVVNRNGKLAKNYAFGGITGQKKKLESEGVVVINDRVDLGRYVWHKL